MAELADAHLIAEHAPGRYAFHDLLRAYAADLARTTDDEAERRQAVHRVLDHYLHSAYSGSLALNPTRAHVRLAPPQPGVTPETLSSVSEARDWFAAERQVLLAAIALADQAGFGTYAWQLPWAVWLLFDRAGYWHDQVAIQRTAVAAAQRLGDLTGQAHACRDLGAAYGRLGQLAEARDYCRQSLDLHRQAGDRLGEARAHNEIMLLAERQGRLAEALGHAQRSLDLYRAEGDEPGQARMLNAVGWIHAKLGDYEQALEYCEQALGMYQGHGDPLNQAATWDSVGYVLFHLGRLDEAIGVPAHRAAHHRGLPAGLLPDHDAGAPRGRLPRDRRAGAGRAGLAGRADHPGGPEPLGRGPGPGQAARRGAAAAGHHLGGRGRGRAAWAAARRPGGRSLTIPSLTDATGTLPGRRRLSVVHLPPPVHPPAGAVSGRPRRRSLPASDREPEGSPGLALPPG